MQRTKSSHRKRDAILEDLAGRDQTSLNAENLIGHIRGKAVLVTGAAGSIGSELCRQIAALGPRVLVGIDQAETPLVELSEELRHGFPQTDFRTELCSVTRCEDVSRAMREYQPSTVFHAAAYKHLPMMERHPFAAVENNVFGTFKVAEAAAANAVESFVLISTDKAVRPASILGVTKRVAEMTICAMQTRQGTRFSAVRFGNVLGSSGSVVPLFRRQIEAGGPVTVTHPEMRRYFMTASEAAHLVLQASVLGEGGEIFVLDMGEPVRILDLARNLIARAGREPDRDIKIEFTGVRPGEKLLEELCSENEQLRPTAHPRIRRIAGSNHSDAASVMDLLRKLSESVDARNRSQLILLLKRLVPEYTPDSELLSDEVRPTSSDTLVGNCEAARGDVRGDESESEPGATAPALCGIRGRS